MFKRMRNQVLSSIVVVAMVFSLMPAIQVQEAKASDVLNVHVSVNASDLAAISCDEIEGATYELYRANSRFADYELVSSYNSKTFLASHYSNYYFYVRATVDGEEVAKSKVFSKEIDMFGENTYIFEETDPMSEIQNVIDTAYKTSEAGQFRSERFAFMFKPSGTEYDVTTKVGFYTQVAGLGLVPDDVKIKQIQCLAEWMKGRKWDGTVNYNALCNFWRSVENVSSDAKLTTWAVSQATAMRKVHLKNAMNLHEEGGYASGGFLADSKIGSYVSCGSQQQWLSRNVVTNANNSSSLKFDYQPAVWNSVEVGCDTEHKQSDWPKGTTTVVDKTPRIAEKPYLAYTEGEYQIVVPKFKENTKGVSWEDYNEGTDYRLINERNYYVAKPTDTAAEIEAGISGKKGLIFSPGIYELDEPIDVYTDDMVILGLGYATLKPVNGTSALNVLTGGQTRVAGILFDAGPKESPNLLTAGYGNTGEYSDDPMVLSDCFFRVGGADSRDCKVKTCVNIDTNDVICDNFWVWRADHGSGVGWTKNTAEVGVDVFGQRVTAYGLMVEHFQKNQVKWIGDSGRTYMYQSELPYDITSQKEWNEDGSYGYTDYLVDGPENLHHEGYGMGIYSCYQKAQCFLESAIKCPDLPGVKFENVCTYSLVGNGGIDHIINNAGYGVYSASDMAKLLSYENGVAKLDKEGDAGKKYIWQCSYDPEIPNKTYTGKAIEPIKSLSLNGIVLRKGVDYTLTYKNNVKVGKASLLIKGIGNFKDYDSLTFNIVPGKAQITKAKGSKKKIKLKYKKVSGATGYQIVYSKKSNFKGKKVKNTKKLKYTIKRKGKKRKKYYVKVRAFAKVSGKTYYGSYSKTKKVK